MSWAIGVDKYGREVGYGIETTCEHESCETTIDKGLSFRCGGVTNLRDDFGCGHFFCGAHLFINLKDQLCSKCFDIEMEKTP